ncbi:sorbitol dehydrogenase [Pelomonas sp. HMWF004]|nr:sorbitol dehydrogenase [Pelomonas sp. HMWF004]
MSSSTPAAPPAAPTAAANTPLQNFVAVSALLTGIAASSLAPPLDPKDIKQLYFDYARAQQPATFDELLSIYSSNAAQPPATIAEIIFTQSGPAISLFARSVMLMWLLGSWYAPEALQNTGTGKPPPDSVVISAAAYTQGWAWNLAQAHPMGYSDLQFGYWANQPPALSDFIGAPS